MKIIQILRYRYLFVLICTSLFHLCCTAQEKSERLVDGIVETLDKYGCNYTTTEEKLACEQLLKYSEVADYWDVFPEGTKCMGTTLSCLKYREYIQNEFFKRTDAKESFANIRMRIHIYSLPDGSVVLRNIFSKDNLLDKLGADGLKQLVKTLKSYKFEQFKASGDYHLGWFFIFPFYTNN